MKVAIVGAGAVGGFLGGLLARAGHDVCVLARGSHLDAIRASGLQVRSSQVGHITVPVLATDHPRELGSNELVIVGVKTYDFAAAPQATAEVLAPEGVAITIQNGLDAPYELAKVIGRERVLKGTASIEATLLEPGVIGHLVPVHALSLSELEGPPTPRLERLANELKVAGLNVTVAADGWRALWEKAVQLIPFATATTAANCSIGALAASPEAIRMLCQLLDEVAAVAWERADAAALIALLREDARWAMPPAALWFDGRGAIELLFRLFPINWQGDVRMVPTTANRQPAAASYMRPHGESAYGLVALNVLRIEGGQIAEITTFSPALLQSFHLPRTL